MAPDFKKVNSLLTFVTSDLCRTLFFSCALIEFSFAKENPATFDLLPSSSRGLQTSAHRVQAWWEIFFWFLSPLSHELLFSELGENSCLICDEVQILGSICCHLISWSKTFSLFSSWCTFWRSKMGVRYWRPCQVFGGLQSVSPTHLLLEVRRGTCLGGLQSVRWLAMPLPSAR